MNSLTTAQTAAGQVPPGQATWRGLGLYFFLLAVQTTGATLIFLQGMPIYRQIVRDFANHQSRPGVLWWAVAAVLLIQIGYWARVRLQPPLPRRSHILIGHLAYFVARLSFIFASSAFAAMFFVRFDQLYLPPPRILALVLLLFSMFCWTLELERLARALQGTEGNL
jgi:hypothetical protein